MTFPPDMSLVDLVAQPYQFVGMFFLGLDDIIYIVVAVLSVASAALSAALRPGPPKPPRPDAIDDFTAPTADDGRPIPVVFGEGLITGPNVVWFGNLSWTERKKEGIVVGYRYFMGMHLAVCAGPVDAVTQFIVGDRSAWTGNVTGSQTVTVTAGGLFGGDDGEGGVSGDVEILFGGPDQGPSDYLSRGDVLDTEVAFRGVLSLVLKGNPGLAGHSASGGAGHYVGTSRYIKTWAVRVLKKPGRVWNAGSETWDRWYEEKALLDDNLANPAHVIYEVLTSAEFGMGYPTAIIDDARHRTAADTLYAEGTGLFLIWVQQTTVEEFLQTVLDHINGTIRLDPATGRFYLKLIRDDYDAAELIELDASNILELESFQRTGWGEAVNEVTVKYRGRNGKTRSVTVQNLAAIRVQGRIVPETKDYPGIRTEALARRIAQRDLRVKSAGLAALRLTANRQAHALGAGDCFRFTWPPLGIADMVMRVGQVQGGTLTEGGITLVAAEDIFGLGGAVFSETDTEEWSEPDTPPDPSTLTPPATPSGLAATSGYQMLRWTWTANAPTAKSELWVSQTNDRAAAVRVFADVGNLYEQSASAGASWYGWARAVDEWNNASGWAPASATGGVLGTAGDSVPGIDDLNDRITVLESGGGSGGNTDNLWTRVEFTATGAYSWDVPDGIAQVWLTAQAAGGGGEAASGDRNGNGGGAGAWCDRRLVSVTPGTTITGAVGAGGPGGMAPLGAGASGGNTTFGAITLGGGAGGSGDVPGAGGTTGTGQAGGAGATRGGDLGGQGGDGLYPGDGHAGNSNNAAATAARFGGGGGGGGINSNGGSRAGGPGGDGFVVIEYQPAAGAQGPAGADGKTVRNGSGAPSSGLGVDGDFYIDTATSKIYGPKVSGAWGSGVSLVGPTGAAGATGATGAAGADGKTVRNGSGAPSSGLGVDGDFYIDTATSKIYGPKASGAWGSGVSLVGPQGATLNSYAVAENATSPDPGSIGWAWSTTLGRPVYWNGSKWSSGGVGTYDFGFGFSGKPVANQDFQFYVFPRPMTIPAAFAGLYGGVNPASGVAPQANYVVTVKFWRGGALQATGTVTFAASTGAVTGSLSSAYAAQAGDIATFTGQATVDANLISPGVTLVGAIP